MKGIARIAASLKIEPTRLKSMAAKHLVRTAQNFLHGTFPLLLGVDDHRLRDAVEALFCSDSVYVELGAKRQGNSWSSKLHCTSLLLHLYNTRVVQSTLLRTRCARMTCLVRLIAWWVKGVHPVIDSVGKVQVPTFFIPGTQFRARQQEYMSVEHFSPFGLYVSNTTFSPPIIRNIMCHQPCSENPIGYYKRFIKCHTMLRKVSKAAHTKTGERNKKKAENGRCLQYLSRRQQSFPELLYRRGRLGM